MEQAASSITPLGLALTLLAGVFLLALPRRYALAPLLICCCYMTLGQVLMVGSLNFSVFRILLFFGLVRIFVRGEISRIKMNSIDKSLLIWMIISVVVYISLRGMGVALAGRSGIAYNVIGTYFLIRSLIHNVDDIIWTIKMMGIIIIPLAVFFSIEHFSGRNPFYILGGVPEFSEVRDGSVRCQGPFRHPILAGTFGSTVIPLFVGLWVHDRKNRRVAVSALLTAAVIGFFSASSGPMMSLVIAFIGLLCWHRNIRHKMKAVRWGIGLLILTAHLLMKAPVWFLISRLSEVTGGSGWYRSALIDAAVRNFDEWWLLGTTYTAHWMPTGLANNPDSADITNQFIAEGVQGGLISMVLFIWLLVKCFSAIGVAIRKEGLFSQTERFVIWTMGCALVGHVAAFFSVSYFDQIAVFFYLLIAMIASLSQYVNSNPNVATKLP